VKQAISGVKVAETRKRKNDAGDQGTAGQVQVRALARGS